MKKLNTAALFEYHVWKVLSKESCISNWMNLKLESVQKSFGEYNYVANQWIEVIVSLELKKWYHKVTKWTIKFSERNKNQINSFFIDK